MTKELFATRKPSWRSVTFASDSINKIKRDLITQILRPIYPQPPGETLIQDFPTSLHWYSADEEKWRCPYGAPGDGLWVRQAWARVEPHPQVMEGYGMPVPWKVEDDPVLLDYWRKRVIFMSDHPGKYPEECGCGASDNVWRSPIGMPRWASQLSLEVTEVHAQRRREIEPNDAMDESAGITPETWVWRVVFRRLESENKPSLAKVFTALDAAQLPKDFMDEADRDRRPAEERPALKRLFES